MKFTRVQKVVLVIFALFFFGAMTRRDFKVDSTFLGGCVIFGFLVYAARD